jgi:hypothetical protein
MEVSNAEEKISKMVSGRNIMGVKKGTGKGYFL